MRAETAWLAEFLMAATYRAKQDEPQWHSMGPLPRALVASLRRRHIGAGSGGADLLAKSTSSGDHDYVAALRLFVAEQDNHARLLARLLTTGGAMPLRGHWSARLFTRLRRALGFRTELMALLIAEVVAVRYYRALRDGSTDPVLVEVARRIHSDAVRHIDFHVARLRAEFAGRGIVTRNSVRAFCWLLLAAAMAVLAVEHGRALRHLRVTRRDFATDTVLLFRAVLRRVLPPVATREPTAAA
ncbi:ferritin-like domain-containing protein [Nocardia sp. NPDC052566]|uniref:ferritin-like domain-containing protein n=1 Tax=Nocardia sp. NPDC052566 TaxID=3364330 RepID=UPI0037CC59CD